MMVGLAVGERVFFMMMSLCDGGSCSVFEAKDVIMRRRLPVVKDVMNATMFPSLRMLRCVCHRGSCEVLSCVFVIRGAVNSNRLVTISKRWCTSLILLCRL